MSPDRRVADLNPTDRPARAPGVTPPARRMTPRQPMGSPEARERSPTPAPPRRGLPVAGDKAAKVMHSVPVDLLDRLKQTAGRSGRSYTDLVIACIVDHRDRLIPDGGEETGPLGALDRRRQRAAHPRARSAQLTLYLTAAERAELDRLAATLGMPRSQLVTAALRQELNDLP